MSETIVLPADIKRSLFIRQIVFLFAIAASVAIGVYVVLWSQTPSYGLLYGSLSGQDVSQVLEALQKAGIDYKVDDNSGAVLVPSARVYEARMKLAAEGLPKSANNGFAILQEEQGLGTSQFIEKARYQHALENEIAKSIAQIRAIRAARVHLALPKQSVFVRERKPPSASVLLNLYPGHQLEDGQVAAIANLVAASVPSLDINHVSIIDQYGRLMTNNQSSPELALTASQFQYARKVEQSFSKRIEDILVPILGPNGVKAQVTAEFDFTSTEQTREAFNPDMPAIRSEQLEEESQAGLTAGGIPGALSNTPAAEGSAPEQIAESNTDKTSTGMPNSKTQRRTTRNYELDKTISHTRLPTGTLRRISAAVVIDYKKVTNAEGKVERVPHSPEELHRFSNLIKEAIGYNEMRGDSVDVINAEFSLPETPEPLPETPIWQQAWVWDIGKQVGGALFVLFLVFGVLKPSLKNMVNKEITVHQAALAAPAGGGVVTGETPQLTSDASAAGSTPQLGAPAAYESNLDAVRNIVAEDPKRAAQVVKNWVGDE